MMGGSAMYHAIYHRKDGEKLYIIFNFERFREFSIHVKAKEI